MIKEKARELAAAIKESEEFKGLQSARARVKLDPTASGLLEALRRTQDKIIALHQQGKEFHMRTTTQRVDNRNPGIAADLRLSTRGGFE